MLGNRYEHCLLFYTSPNSCIHSHVLFHTFQIPIHPARTMANHRKLYWVAQVRDCKISTYSDLILTSKLMNHIRFHAVGGQFEAVAVHDSDELDGPTFFVTEDRSDGALRRVETSCRGWDALKIGGCPSTTTYLRFLDNPRFEWTTDVALGRQSASKHYPNTEGIVYNNGKLSFISKVGYVMFTLDFDTMTWTRERTGKAKLIGEGSFAGQPDGVISGFNHRYMYFTEETKGRGNGMYARDEYGMYYTVFEAMSGQFVGDETVGLAISPDGKTMYVGYQENGVLFALKRNDNEVWDRK